MDKKQRLEALQSRAFKLNKEEQRELAVISMALMKEDIAQRLLKDHKIVWKGFQKVTSRSKELARAKTKAKSRAERFLEARERLRALK